MGLMKLNCRVFTWFLAVCVLCSVSIGSSSSLQCPEAFELPGDQVYNRVYIQYYGLDEMAQFLTEMSPVFSQANYQLEQIGESVEGRPLMNIKPKELVKDKKTVVLFCRHHGDEGTANWILEGFLRDFFARGLQNEYQLIVYPMVNPDGVVARARENANGWDLNRVWDIKDYGRDEIKYVHQNFQEHMELVKKETVVVQDLHGSFVRDFIYRVDRNFVSPEFFEMQGQFISTYGEHDPWQAGQYDVSNGRPGMARIVMISEYGLNAMTHETPRNIRLDNSQGRSKETLMNQGIAMLEAIIQEYSSN